LKHKKKQIMSTPDLAKNHGLWQLGGTPPIGISSDT
jgi:prolyl-tRNA editing enzyme YbaK/EbsC (Cys-tRNA(Pro) deacylase)